MNEKTKENVGGKIAAGMNKAELNALIDAVINTKFNQRIEDKKAKGGMINKYAKGGEVKKYMGGGSVHKKKNKMLTTKGWGASRKT